MMCVRCHFNWDECDFFDVCEMNESCHTDRCQERTQFIWEECEKKSHSSQMMCLRWDYSFIRVTWLIHMCAMTHSCAAWLIQMCDTTHSHVWHDTFICETWRIHMCEGTHPCVWHDSFVCVPWLILTCATTHSHVRHDSFICATWLIHMCAMTHSYVCHDSFIRVTRLIHMCNTTHSYVRHDSFICVTWLSYVTWVSHITHESSMRRKSHVQHMNASQHLFSLPRVPCSTLPWHIHVLYARHICHDTFMCYRVAKTHRVPYLYRSFSAKVTYI